jgi:dihydroneopterin aldolase
LNLFLKIVFNDRIEYNDFKNQKKIVIEEFLLRKNNNDEKLLKKMNYPIESLETLSKIKYDDIIKIKNRIFKNNIFILIEDDKNRKRIKTFLKENYNAKEVKAEKIRIKKPKMKTYAKTTSILIKIKPNNIKSYIYASYFSYILSAKLERLFREKGLAYSVDDSMYVFKNEILIIFYWRKRLMIKKTKLFLKEALSTNVDREIYELKKSKNIAFDVISLDDVIGFYSKLYKLKT